MQLDVWLFRTLPLSSACLFFGVNLLLRKRVHVACDPRSLTKSLSLFWLHLSIVSMRLQRGTHKFEGGGCGRVAVGGGSPNPASFVCFCSSSSSSSHDPRASECGVAQCSELRSIDSILPRSVSSPFFSPFAPFVCHVKVRRCSCNL